MQPIDVLIVDDHEVVRLGIRRLLEEAGFSVTEADSGEAALQLIRQDVRTRVVLMDIQMPGMGGLEATRRMLACTPGNRIIILTAIADGPLPRTLLKAGAHGYLTKGCSVDEMTRAIRRVAAGERYVSGQVAQSLALSLVDGEGESPFDLLSRRELQFVMLLSQGLRNSAIAKTMNVSSKTVSTYRARASTKLGVSSEAQMIRLALEHGVVGRA
ncbi:MAG: response regulator [Gammaproteobacteria bacterium]|nr:response regulator [Gammaproteobacteria bacterium]